MVALFLRSPIDLNVTPVRNPLYVTLSDGSIRNTYEVRLRNKHGEARPFGLSLTAVGDDDRDRAEAGELVLTLEGRDDTTSSPCRPTRR